METEREQAQGSEQSGGGGWLRAVWILAILLALYVLSVGPAAKVYHNDPAPPKALVAFYQPLEFAYKRSHIVKVFFDWYLHIWRIR